MNIDRHSTTINYCIELVHLNTPSTGEISLFHLAIVLTNKVCYDNTNEKNV